MQFFYFLTIDKVKLGVPPLKQDLLTIRNDICSANNLSVIHPYQVQCFEYKDKGKVHGRYLHYHCMLYSSDYYIDYKKIRVPNWSLKLERLRTSTDVAITSGYIMKLKKDHCDINIII